jgi:hypothetical protein
MYPIVLTYADLNKAIKIEYTLARADNKIILSWVQEGGNKEVEDGNYTLALQDEEATLLDLVHYAFNNIVPLSEYIKVTNFANRSFLTKKLSFDVLFRIIEKHEEIISLNEVIEDAYVEH